MNNGYIKLDRKLLNWQWRDKPEMIALWIYVLLQANYQENKWHGQTYEIGSFPTSIRKISEETGLSIKQVRTGLERLEKSGEIGTQRAHSGIKINVIKWALYQGNDTDEEEKRAHKGHTKGTQRALLKESKKERNKEYIERNIKERKSFFPPTILEVSEYCKSRNNNVDAERFVDFYQSKNWFVGKNKMKDWKAAVRTWEKRDNPKPKDESIKYEMDLGDDYELPYY